MAANQTNNNIANNATVFTFPASIGQGIGLTGPGSGNTRLKYCCDLDKTVLAQNFEKRGWISVNPDDDWNFYW